MKISTKLILVAVLLTTAVVLFGNFRSTNEHRLPSDGRPEVRVSPDGQRAPFIGEPTESKETALSREEQRGEFEMLLATLPEKTQKYYRMAFESGLEEFVFHGRVVDQLGDVVADATVRYEVTGYFLAAGPGMGAKLTDADGRFRIHSEGGGLDVRAIEHPEIDEFVFEAGQGKAKRMIVPFYGFQPVVDGTEYLWSDYTEENPFIFKVWRVLKGETRGVTKGRVGFSLNPDARVYTVDLTANYGRGKVVEGEGKGQLRIRFFRADEEGVDYWKPDNSWIKRDWWVEVSAVDGDLQPVPDDDPYMNLAPESGYYSPTARFEMPLDEHYKQKLANIRYYYNANGGAIYGVIDAEFIAVIRGGPVVRIRHKTNAEGRRHLVAQEATY